MPKYVSKLRFSCSIQMMCFTAVIDPIPPELTVNCAVAEAVPPAPVAFAVYVVVEVGVTVAVPPETAGFVIPEMVSAVAFVVVHVKVAGCPGPMTLGVTFKVTVGFGVGGVTVSVINAVEVPPGPLAVAV